MLETKRLKKFLVITFCITWTLWWGEALLVKYTLFQANGFIASVLFIAGGFGPTIASFFCLDRKNYTKKYYWFYFHV